LGSLLQIRTGGGTHYMESVLETLPLGLHAATRRQSRQRGRAPHDWYIRLRTADGCVGLDSNGRATARREAGDLRTGRRDAAKA